MAERTTDDVYDQWLVLCAQEGDAAAMSELVDRWQPRLLRHAYRLTEKQDVAADVTQLAWVAIIGGLHHLADPACFRRWAYRIVGNKAVDWLRTRLRDRTQMTVLSTDPIDPREQIDATQQDEIALLQAAMRKLSSEHRGILSLFYVEEMPLAEIAEVLNIALGTVKSRLHQAKCQLKQHLERKES